MKKSALAIIIATTMFSGAFQASAEVADKLLLYIPNRLVDLSDLISLSMGFGPKVKFEARATRFVSFGAGVGASAVAVKDYNRQYGGALQNGWDASFICVSGEDTERGPTSKYVKKYWYNSSGVPSPFEDIYNFYDGARDYWEIGVDVACLVDVSFSVHPVEIADFVTGWFFIDLKGDDISVDDFN